MASLLRQIRRIRRLTAVIAVVNVDEQINDFPALPPGAMATKRGLLLTRMKRGLRSRGAIWKLAASQNSAVVPTTQLADVR